MYIGRRYALVILLGRRPTFRLCGAVGWRYFVTLGPTPGFTENMYLLQLLPGFLPTDPLIALALTISAEYTAKPTDNYVAAEKPSLCGQPQLR